MDDSGGGGKHKGGGVRSKKMSTRVDMTPMVDLAFLLVTFFMLTTTFNKPTVMDIKMPAKTKDENQNQEIKESESMTVIMDGGDTLWYYHGITDPVLEMSNYSDNGIRQIILKKKEDLKAKSDTARINVLLKATSRASFKNVVDMFDEMSITSVPVYALVDMSKVDKDLIFAKTGRMPADAEPAQK